MFFGDYRKLKFRAYVEHWAKMDIPQERWGNYVVLEVNDHEITRWKLSRLDEISVLDTSVSEQHYVSIDEWYIIQGVHQDGLDQFVANKISEVFELVFAGNLE